jgi:RimJ/RimL family protein N-acetyltransferase
MGTNRMILSENAVIRTAEPDDAGALKRLYDPGRPRCCLLDPRHEPMFPTFDELREVMSKSEMGQPFLYAVEDTTGMIRGFCSLRAMNIEACFGEILVMFHDDADFAAPLASDVLDFLARRAFQQFHMNKIVSHALDNEQPLRDALLRHGFISNGVQRESVYTLGRWYGIESFTLDRRNTPYAREAVPAVSLTP